MSRTTRSSPRLVTGRPRRTANIPDEDRLNSSDPDNDAPEPDIDVTKMKTLFEQTPKVNPSSATPHPQPRMRQGGGWGMHGALGSVRDRLEKTLLGVPGGEEERQVSPSLRQLRMTPGRALQKQRILERKHHEAKSRAHTLGVGGGISLWPQMDNMRLTRNEVASLGLVSLLLVLGAFALFQHLHGFVLDSLRSSNRQLVKFPTLHRVDSTGQEDLDKSVLAWHMAFTNLMDSVHHEFDTQWPKTLGTYQLCALLYITSVGLLLYYLADNMFTTSRLTPQRIKIWVSLLVITGTWSVLMVYLLGQAQRLEANVESNVHSLSNHLGDLVFLELSLNRYKDVLMYWRTRCLPPTTTGTLSIMGVLQVRDVSYYLQYYSLPILTALLTPVVRLVLAVKQVYSQNK